MTEHTAIVVRQIVSELENLPDEKIIEVLNFVKRLKSGSPYQTKRYHPRVLNESQLAKQYGESAEEDKQLAEMGTSDFADSLKAEDGNAKR